MKVELLIIGQGVAGSFLALECLKHNISFAVIDRSSINSASLIAGAILHPLHNITGNVLQPKEKEIAEALKEYRLAEKLLGIKVVQDYTILSANPAFSKVNNAYCSKPDEDLLKRLSADFYNAGNFVSVSPVYKINGPLLLGCVRNYLLESNLLLEEKFEQEALLFANEGVEYKNLQAKAIVFCTGAEEISFLKSEVRLIPNRGEVLFLRIPGLNQHFIYQDELRLTPMGDQVFWFGTNHNWKFENNLPDKEWKDRATEKLQRWLKHDFELLEHRVGLRPTTAGQITYCGKLPGNKNAGFINGLGTRGFTLAPLLAKRFIKDYRTD